MSGSGGGGMSNLRRQASMLKLLGGEVYTEHYQQKKELGRGKFGVVYQVNRPYIVFFVSIICNVVMKIVLKPDGYVLVFSQKISWLLGVVLKSIFYETVLID